MNIMTNRRTRRFALLLPGLVALTLVAAACGEDENTVANAAADDVATTVTATTADADADHDEADADADGEDLFALEAADSFVVEMQDIKFVPADLTVAAGELVELQMLNTGAIDHDFTIEQIDVTHAVHGSEEMVAGHEDDGDVFALHQALMPGDEATLRMRVHEPGTYQYYCTVPGHREGGMIGTLTVTE